LSEVSDVVDAALARAIEAEVEARGPGWEGRVAVLTVELRTRRLDREGVVVLGRETQRKGS
jgi:phage baseplate assembly protein W